VFAGHPLQPSQRLWILRPSRDNPRRTPLNIPPPPLPLLTPAPPPPSTTSLAAHTFRRSVGCGGKRGGVGVRGRRRRRRRSPFRRPWGTPSTHAAARRSQTLRHRPTGVNPLTASPASSSRKAAGGWRKAADWLTPSCWPGPPPPTQRGGVPLGTSKPLTPLGTVVGLRALLWPRAPHY